MSKVTLKGVALEKIDEKDWRRVYLTPNSKQGEIRDCVFGMMNDIMLVTVVKSNNRGN